MTVTILFVNMTLDTIYNIIVQMQNKIFDLDLYLKNVFRNPTPNDFPTVWTPTTKEQIKAFVIDVNLKPVEVLEKIRLHFWDSFEKK